MKFEQHPMPSEKAITKRMAECVAEGWQAHDAALRDHAIFTLRWDFDIDGKFPY